jgi:hypothetical protein
MALSIKWINHIEAWKGSGLKQSDYCKQQALNYNTFSARISEYRKAHSESLPALIPVQIRARTPGSMALTHAKGHRLELPNSISAAWLAELLRCLD